MFRKLKTLLLIGIAVVLAGLAGVRFFNGGGEGGNGGNGGGGRGSGSPQTSEGEKPPAPESGAQSDKEQTTGPVIALPAIKEQPIGVDTPVGNEQEAQGAVDEVASELGLGDGSELQVGGSTDDGLGNTYYQVQQQYRGIDVYGAVSVLEVENGEAGQLYGTWVQDLELDIEPIYDAAIALRMALTDMGVPETREVEVLGTEARLIIVTGDQIARLCWLFQASLTNPGSPPEIFIVDAHTPEIVSRERAMRR